MGKANVPIPDYKVVDSKVTTAPSGVKTLSMIIQVAPNAIGFEYAVDEIAMRTGQYDVVKVTTRSPPVGYQGVTVIANSPAGQLATDLTDRYAGDTGSCRYAFR